MAVARSTRRARPIAVLLLISLTLILLDRSFSGPVDWVRAGAQDLFAVGGSAASAHLPFNESRELVSLREENQALREQLAEAQGTLFAVQDQRRQFEEITSLVSLQTPDDVDRVIARVTATDTSNFDAAVEISKGSGDNIAVGMPVVTGAGLVGRVIQTSHARSTVLLITDSTFEVGIRFSTSGDVGLSVGQGAGKDLRADLVELTSAVSESEIAVTNGQQHSLFPPGIPVARVTSSTASDQDLRRNVTMAPTADMANLDTVAVFLWTPPS